MVVLWTDLCLFALVIGVGVWLTFALRREYWRVALRQVMTDRVAMISCGVLCVYLAIGLMDSIHFRETSDDGKVQGQVISLLDKICAPLRTNAEKTYSAPLAVRSFAKETITLDDGTQIRDYPYLVHGGSHLPEPREAHRAGNITKRIALALLVGGLFAGLYFGCLWLTREIYRRRASRKNHEQENLRTFTRRGIWIAGFLSVVTALAVILGMLATGYHVFGTDKAGGDVFYTAIKSIRTGLVIGLLTTVIVTPFALLFGILAGYLGGRVDDIITYVYSTLESIPSILLIVAGMIIFQFGQTREEMIFSADKRLLYLCCIMGITTWTGLCRLIRGEVFKLREVEYVQAAEAFGVWRIGVMFRHLAPNVMHIVLITIVLRFSGLVLVEAVLAYIGIGVDPSMPSWGNMINVARLELARDPVVWWQLLAAFVFMFGLVLPANLFGDAVRDALDPRLRTQ